MLELCFDGLTNKRFSSLRRLLRVYQILKLIKILKDRNKDKRARPKEQQKQQQNFEIVVQKALSDLRYFKKCVLRQRLARREILNKILDNIADEQDDIKYQDYLQSIQQSFILEEQILLSQIQFYCQNNRIQYDGQFIEKNFNRILLSAKSFGNQSYLQEEDIIQNFIKMKAVIEQNYDFILNIQAKIINYSDYQILKIMNIVVLDICATQKQYPIYDEEDYINQVIKNPQKYISHQNEIKNLIF